VSKLDDVTAYIREKLSGYIGKPNSGDLKERLTEDLVGIIGDVTAKFDDPWKDGPPSVGDFVHARVATGCILEPDDLSKPLYDSATGTISFIFMLPGTPLLVLATEGRDPDNIRVMSIWSGDVGWMHLEHLRPFEP
jgi:hypothetical protein